ncbi:hypothetical protein GPECTOR_12g519 [Gonium pectorale]|uniref:AAA+ ATPase domain-containing protein n=1 Tax=Gonium pectorale TaxID=33097 RepID=A0A150GNX2_GONPE|nr:hypothetical protein GPECTOR_12g519 [Gonium pectorale]|eukprot:KXZ51556.1 hypothetical protein GPECTOR_12g519 [Gonium pectorale]
MRRGGPEGGPLQQPPKAAAEGAAAASKHGRGAQPARSVPSSVAAAAVAASAVATAASALGSLADLGAWSEVARISESLSAAAAAAAAAGADAAAVDVPGATEAVRAPGAPGQAAAARPAAGAVASPRHGAHWKALYEGLWPLEEQLEMEADAMEAGGIEAGDAVCGPGGSSPWPSSPYESRDQAAAEAFSGSEPFRHSQQQGSGRMAAGAAAGGMATGGGQTKKSVRWAMPVAQAGLGSRQAVYGDASGFDSGPIEEFMSLFPPPPGRMAGAALAGAASAAAAAAAAAAGDAASLDAFSSRPGGLPRLLRQLRLGMWGFSQQRPPPPPDAGPAPPAANADAGPADLGPEASLEWAQQLRGDVAAWLQAPQGQPRTQPWASGSFEQRHRELLQQLAEVADRAAGLHGPAAASASAEPPPPAAVPDAEAVPASAVDVAAPEVGTGGAGPSLPSLLQEALQSILGPAVDVAAAGLPTEEAGEAGLSAGLHGGPAPAVAGGSALGAVEVPPPLQATTEVMEMLVSGVAEAMAEVDGPADVAQQQQQQPVAAMPLLWQHREAEPPPPSPGATAAQAGPAAVGTSAGMAAGTTSLQAEPAQAQSGETGIGALSSGASPALGAANFVTPDAARADGAETIPVVKPGIAGLTADAVLLPAADAAPSSETKGAAASRQATATEPGGPGSSGAAVAAPAEARAAAGAGTPATSESAQKRVNAYKAELLARALSGPEGLSPTFEAFPYFLGTGTKERLMAAATLHLLYARFAPFAADLAPMSPRVLLSGPYGSDLYQRALVSALAAACGARLLVFDRTALGLDEVAAAATAAAAAATAAAAGGAGAGGVDAADYDSDDSDEFGLGLWRPPFRLTASTGFWAPSGGGGGNKRRRVMAFLAQPPSVMAAAAAAAGGASPAEKGLGAATLRDKGATVSAAAGGDKGQKSLQKGDRVRFCPGSSLKRLMAKAFGDMGRTAPRAVGVRFDTPFAGGLDLGGACEAGHGYFVSPAELEPLPQQPQSRSQQQQGQQEQSDGTPATAATATAAAGSRSAVDEEAEAELAAAVALFEAAAEAAARGPVVVHIWLLKSFPNLVTLHPPHGEPSASEWRTVMERDAGLLREGANRRALAALLGRCGIACPDLEAVVVRDQALTSEAVERVVGWAVASALQRAAAAAPAAAGAAAAAETRAAPGGTGSSAAAAAHDAAAVAAADAAGAAVADKEGAARTELASPSTTAIAAADLLAGLATLKAVAAERVPPSKQGLQDAQIQDVQVENDFERKLLAEVVPPEELGVSFDSIGALEGVKETLREVVMLPLQRPELFTRGTLTKPTKGVLLFGPPGTGKTMLAKAVASECGANFLYVSLSSVTSKWFGEAEKYIRAVFSLAHKIAPSVIFVDEVDSLLGKRSGGSSEHEASRKMKNEFMAHWDGLKTRQKDRVMVLAATNRPMDLDEAVIRRMPRRIMVDLPDAANRAKILKVIMRDEHLDPSLPMDELAALTEGYSGSDLKNLSVAAAYRPIRELLAAEKAALASEAAAAPTAAAAAAGAAAAVAASAATPPPPPALRSLTLADFKAAMEQVGPSVAAGDMGGGSLSAELRRWNESYGEGGKRKLDTLTYFL